MRAQTAFRYTETLNHKTALELVSGAKFVCKLSHFRWFLG